MSDYTLHQLASRIISVRRGRWRFFVIQVISLADSACVAQHVIFANLNRRGDLLRKRISSTCNTASDQQLVALAGKADEREFQTTGGRMIVRRPSLRTDDAAWIVELEFGSVIPVKIAPDKLISDLDDGDLRVMAALFNRQLSA